MDDTVDVTNLSGKPRASGDDPHLPGAWTTGD